MTTECRAANAVQFEVLLNSLSSSVRDRKCWLCESESDLSGKVPKPSRGKRIFSLIQLLEFFSEIHASLPDTSDPRYPLLFQWPNLLAWWEAYVSAGGFINHSSFEFSYGLICDSQLGCHIGCDAFYRGMSRCIAPENSMFSMFGTVELFSLEHWRKFLCEQSLEGWLTKRSHDYFRVLQKWQSRYFVLDCREKTLSYFDDESKSILKGTYFLNGNTEVLPSTQDGQASAHPFKLRITGITRSQTRDLYVNMDSVRAANFWFAAIRYTVMGRHHQVLEIFNWMHTFKSFCSRCLNEYETLMYPKLRESEGQGRAPIITSSMEDETAIHSEELGKPTGESHFRPRRSLNSEQQRLHQNAIQLSSLHSIEDAEPVAQLVLRSLVQGDVLDRIDFEITFCQLSLLEELVDLFVDLKRTILDVNIHIVYSDLMLAHLETMATLLSLRPLCFNYMHVRYVSEHVNSRSESLEKLEMDHCFSLEAFSDDVIRHGDQVFFS